ncbi:DDE-type integrase/transposase/recombinase (plasmid) [Mycobacterium europaeum]|uniref:DDE-type integrase/transposase/recombinase n=1 Tax=Mycobacterium europaeum TaxID=761804 RepID=UPI0032AEEF64
MDSEADGHHCTSGLNPWRARCGEIRSAGSEGGPGKRIGRNADTAPRSDPYTEHPARDGKVYCCAILDCFSRMIVARTFSTTADTALVNNAVNMAVDNRTLSSPTILHADHGTQFTSWSFGENMRRWGLLGSFGTVGDCFDNAAMESFWARMQVELLNTRKWATTIELAAAMADYIDNFYNVERRHSYLGNISPTEFETLWTSTYSIPQLA